MRTLYSLFVLEGIPINVKNTNRPQDPGTLIVESTCHKPQHVITGTCWQERLCNCHD